MNLQLQNWNNFCRYHAVGNWHGNWIKYSSEGKIIQSFRAIRSLHSSTDGNQIGVQPGYLHFRTRRKDVLSRYLKTLILRVSISN